jgi:hypothetical protein
MTMPESTLKGAEKLDQFLQNEFVVGHAFRKTF